MRSFADLYRALDETTSINEKVRSMAAYFEQADPRDAAWAVFFLSGRRLKRLVKNADLWAWAVEYSGISPWLFEESRHVVGDFAETIALLLPKPMDASDRPLHDWVEDDLLSLRNATPDKQRSLLHDAWSRLEPHERFVWNKLITGSFRVGVSQTLLIRALSSVSGVAEAALAHRLMGHWDPSPEFYRALVSKDLSDSLVSRPYPFCLAHALEGSVEALGDRSQWQAEWKWDGIRAQVLRRSGQTFIWSRGEDLVTDRFPEVAAAASQLPDGTVLDGELLAWKDGHVLPFGELQRRIGRKQLGRKLLQEVPVSLLAFDLLEEDQVDIRGVPLRERRTRLERLLGRGSRGIAIQAAPVLIHSSWDELARLREGSRDRLVEGLMLKRGDAGYEVGRKKGIWWKWKIEPYSVDAVLMYAQRGHGKRATLYTDYTFGVWDGDALVPFAKAYSGLSDEEIREVDRFVRRHTAERFGPVRSVKPELVFEIAFEGIRKSTRHRSGVAVRFPRMARWRRDKSPGEADTIEALRHLLG